MSTLRSKFKMTVADGKAYADNTSYLKKDFKAMYIDWTALGDLPVYKEAVCKDTNDFQENIGTIVPYIIESPLNMWLAAGLKGVGSIAYMNRVVRHAYVGDSNDNFLCVSSMYGKHCPLCEEKFALKKGKPKGWEAPESLRFLNNSIRDLYLFVPVIGEQAGKLTLLDVSNHLFTKDFESALFDFTQTRARDMKRLFEKQQSELQAGNQPTGKLITHADILNMPEFCDPESGFDVRFMIRPEKKNGTTSNKYMGFTFIPRDPIPDAILDKSIDLAKCLILPDAATVERLMQESFAKVVDTANGVEATTADGAEDEFTMTDEKAEVLQSTPFDTAPPTTQTTTVTVATEVTPPPPPAPAKEVSTCPHNIMKKNSDFKCMQCPPAVKNICTRN